jgi:hypothetical protein
MPLLRRAHHLRRGQRQDNLSEGLREDPLSPPLGNWASDLLCNRFAHNEQKEI